MPHTKLLVRAAVRLHDAWSQAAHRAGCRHSRLMGQFDDCHRALMGARDRLVKASNLQLPVVLADLQREVRIHLNQLHSVAGQIVDEEPETVSGHPLRWFLEELRQIEADFVDLRIDLKTNAVSAMTEPITLEEIYLGNFLICLRWE